MATSGSSNWTATRAQIIRMAALDLGAIPSSGSPNAQIVADFDFSLNAMVKAWAADGIKVWVVSEATLFPQADTVKYSVGSSGTAHVTGTYYETALSADEASGQTILSIDANTNMTDADNIGIVLDDGSLQWTTISSSTSTTVTIATALTDSASEDAAVFFYTSKIGRPLRIVDARLYNISGDTDTPIGLISRQEYQGLASKTATGAINQMFYDKQLNTGQIYLWQPLETITDLVKFTYHRTIEDFDAASDNADLPVEWIMALRYGLAQSMYTQYPVSRERGTRIDSLFDRYFNMVIGSGEENESIFLQPDVSGYVY